MTYDISNFYDISKTISWYKRGNQIKNENLTFFLDEAPWITKFQEKEETIKSFPKQSSSLKATLLNFSLPFIFLIAFNLVFYEIFYKSVLNVLPYVTFRFLRFLWKIKNQIVLHHIFLKVLKVTSFHLGMKMYRTHHRVKDASKQEIFHTESQSHSGVK